MALESSILSTQKKNPKSLNSLANQQCKLFCKSTMPIFPVNIIKFKYQNNVLNFPRFNIPNIF